MSNPSRTDWWDDEQWREELPTEEAMIASACQYLLVKDAAGAVPLLLAAEAAFKAPNLGRVYARLPVEMFGPPRLYDLLSTTDYGEDFEKRELIEAALRAPMPHSLAGLELNVEFEPRMQVVEPYFGWREEFGQQASGRGITNQGAGRTPAPLRWMHNNFRTAGEIAIAKALEQANALFMPLPRAAIGTTADMRTMVEPDFVVCHDGKWGVLEIDGSSHEGRKAQDTEKDRLYHAHSISVVRRYTEEQARDHPDVIVAEFLRDVDKLG